jgi:hypothetical protein
MKALVSATSKLMPALQRQMHPVGRKRKRQTKTKIKQAKTDCLAKPKTVSLPPPQVWVTMMWHMGLGLPWCWKLGPSNASERNHVKEMLEIGHFFADTLFVGDAGFVGYDFWRAITDRGHHFMVRVGANVNLLTGLCTQQRDGKEIVYCWPHTTMNANDAPTEDDIRFSYRLAESTKGRVLSSPPAGTSIASSSGITSNANETSSPKLLRALLYVSKAVIAFQT